MSVTDSELAAGETLAAPQTLPSADVIRDLHLRMVRIREFETEAGRLMEAGEMPGFLHLYVGQEAVAAGVMSTLEDSDQITSTHRGHGHAVAKGAEFRPMFAELFGKIDGYCMGRGGSMHINDLSIGMYGANGVVGAGIPIALGTAFANRYRDNRAVSATFFGDGASNIGAFHEAANMAAVLRLPVIFVCENNGYAEFTPQSKHMLPSDVADRAASYGMPSEICDGMNVLDVRASSERAVERARTGGGPTMIEAKTYRYYDHQGVKGLRKTYRTAEEVAQWRERDAIDHLEKHAVAAGLVEQAEFDATWERIKNEVAEAIEFARQSPMPDVKDFDRNVYSD